MIYVIIGIILVLLFWGFSPRKIGKRRPGRANKFPYRRLAEGINILRRSGYDGARFVIKEHGSEKFVQFVKKISKDNKPNVIFGFPITTWSQECLDAFKKELHLDGINYEERETDMTLPQRWLPEYVKTIKKYVEVECNIDLEKALLVNDKVLKCLGLGQETLFDVTHFDPIDTHDKVIGFTE